jgi:glycosyltransferase involved in cell wall biosynthesis
MDEFAKKLASARVMRRRSQKNDMSRDNWSSSEIRFMATEILTPPGIDVVPETSLARLRGRTPIERETLVLSVLIPVYNEERTIELIVSQVRSAPVVTEVICVNDHSTDRSGEMLDRLHADGLVDRVIHQPYNMGKGAAIRTALNNSTGNVVIVQDADLEYDPADWPAMLEPIVSGQADAVFGSRFLGGPHRVLYYWHSVGNTVLTTVSNMFTNLNLTDMETCYKAIRGEIARSLVLTADRFGFEPEITARLAQAGARVYEVPVSYAGRTYAEGKKISWKDGVAAFWHIVRFNLFPPPRARSKIA